LLVVASAADLERCLPAETVLSGIPLLILARNSCEEMAIRALRAGATDYVKIPEQELELETAIRRLRGISQTRNSGVETVMLGASPEIQQVHQQVVSVSQVPTNVLITGETGTGKELVAHLLHELSPRRARPFVSINCAAIPEALLESELFGSEQGAYTGAHRRFEGKLRQSCGGTVFLDEIGEMSLNAQAKILRAIETKEVQRLGGDSPLSFDARIVAATNRDLLANSNRGLFRKDLYYRIRVMEIRVPPLRDRRQDIGPLFQYFVQQISAEFGRTASEPSTAVLEQLDSCDWPGNVRELRNVAESYVVQGELPSDISRTALGSGPLNGNGRDRLMAALESTRWNKAETARRLRWSRMTVYRKMAEYKILDTGGDV
jgi:two-component system response regulator HydG/two-component system response regulator AtoC